MAADQKLEALHTVGLFNGCNKKELKAVAALCTPVRVDEGFVLTTQGGLGRECFVIADGIASVTINGAVVAEVGPGDCVGEMSLLDGGRRSATVTASSAMTLYVLSAGEFQALLEHNPVIDRKIMIGLARRLRDVETHLVH
jgi:CRP/FNR family cyclic AMP-dependent transcriptional regulator